MTLLSQRLKRLRGSVRVSIIVSLLLGVLVPAFLWAAAPAWWTQRGVLVAGATADDYAAVNQGQLKHIAKQGYEEMKAKLPGGAGSTLDSIWANPAISTDDYRAINLGQLKAVGEPFYARLQQLNYIGQPLAAGQTRPWSGTADDYALVNLGQLKNVFSFDVSSLVAAGPAVPTGLVASAVAFNGFTLTWAAPAVGSPAVIAYDIYRGGVLVGTVAGSTRTYAVSGLAPATLSAMTVRARDTADLASAPSATLNVTTLADQSAPSVPTGLAGLATGVTSFTLTWTAATDNVAVDRYDVYRAGILLGSTTVRHYNVTGLTPSIAHAMTVRARDAAGNASAQSTALNVTTLAATSDTTAPSIPVGLAAVSITVNSFTLNWSASTDNVAVTAYDVYRDGEIIGSTTSTVRTLGVATLKPSTSYVLTVRARDAAGNVTAQSAALTVTTLADTTAPTVPTALASSARTLTSFTFTWGASTDSIGVATYDVYRGGVLIASTATRSLSIAGLVPGSSYIMTVRARDTSGNASAQSTALTVATLADTTAPTVPGNFNRVARTATSVDFTWSASTDNYAVAAYELYNGATLLATIPAPATSYTLSGLVASTVYNLKLRAKDAAGNVSGYSPVWVVCGRGVGAPSFILGLQLWLQGDISPSGVIDTWPDQSGLDNHGTQLDNSAWRPERVAASMNGYGVVRFDGVDDVLNIPDLLSSATEGEIYIVNRLANFDNQYNGLCQFGVQNGVAYSEDNGDLIWEDFGIDDGAPFAGPGSSTLTQVNIYNSSITTAGVSMVRFNGIPLQTRTASGVVFTSTPLLGNDRYNEHFRGDIAEVIVYNRALTPAERDAVHVYLAAKYAPPGIVVPAPPVLAAHVVHSTAADISWGIPTGKDQQLVATLERQAGVGVFQVVARLENTWTYSDIGLTPGQPYTYRVKLTSYAGASAYSTPVTITPTLGLNAPSPTGLRLWLRSTMGVPSEGPVAVWADQSGLGNDAVQLDDPNKRPELIQNTINAYPAIRFDGNHRLNLPDLLSTATAGEIIAVLKVGDKTLGGYADLNNKIWDFGSNGTGYIRNPGDADYYHYNSFGLVSSQDTAVSLSKVSGYHVYSVSSTGAAWAERYNGTVNKSATGQPVSFSSNPSLGVEVFVGDFAEVLVYDRALTSSERTSVENYLAAKYSLGVIDTAAPSIPTGLVGTARTINSFTLTWTASTDNVGVVGYDVYRDGTLIGSPTTTTFSVTGLNPGTAYSMTVRARDTAGNASTLSAALSVSTLSDTAAPSVPTGLNSSNLTSSSFTLTWAASTDNVAVVGYDVYRDGTLIGSPSTRTFAVTGLSVATTYQFKVRARDAAGNASAQSTALAVTPVVDTVAPTIPTGLTATAIGTTGFTLGWTASTDSAGVAGYDVYRGGVLAGSTTSATTFPIAGLSPLTLSSMTVRARDASNNASAQSAPFAVTTLADTTPPSVPGSLIRTARAATTISLSWTAATDDIAVTSYELYNNNTLLATFSATSTTGNLSGLNPSTAYNLKLRGKDAAGNASAFTAILADYTLGAGTPRTLSGLKLWLQGHTAATGTLAAWRDQSGLDNHATQTIATRQPTVIANALNGQAVVRFDGAHRLELPNILGTTTAGEIIAVLKIGDKTLSGYADLNNKIWDFGGNGTGYIKNPGATDYYHYNSFGLVNSQDTAVPLAKVSGYHVYSVSSTGAAWAEYYNGVVNKSAIGQAVSFSSNPSLGVEVFVGDFAEIIVYDRALTSAERVAVQTYLATKYAPPGITIPSAPTLTAYAASSTTADLSWSTATGSDQHLVAILERQTGAGAFTPIATLSDQYAYSYSDTSLTPSQSYTYRVKLQSYVGTSAYSPPVTITPLVGISPPPSAGVRLWLRSTGGVPASGPVSAWFDQSGRFNDATQSESIHRPTVASNGVYGFPVVRFDAAQNQYLRLPNFMSGASTGEAFAVLRRDKTYPYVSGLWSLGSGNGSRYPESNSKIQDDFASNQWTPTGLAPAFLGDFHIYNVGGDASTWFQKLNGSAYTTRTGNTVSFRSDPTIGAGMGGGVPFAGDFTEIIIYDKVLTVAERTLVENYLTTKYRLAALDFEAPTVPTGLVSTVRTATSFTLSWTASIDIVGVAAYDVYRDGILIGSTTTPSFIVSGLTPGTAYTMTVRARDTSSNASALSAAVSVTTLIDTSAPTAPTGLVATNLSYNSFTLNWTASTDDVGVIIYDVYRNGVLMGCPTAPGFLAAGLDVSTTYQFTVRARDAAGNASPLSAALAVTTVVDTVAPTVPAGLTATAIRASGFTLRWTASTDSNGVAAYDIYNGGVFVGSTATATGFQITGLLPSTVSSMTVLARDASNNASAQSAPFAVTTIAYTSAPSIPSTPTLTVYSASSTTADLSWGIAAGADQYMVAVLERQTGTGSFTTIARLIDSFTYSDIGITPGQPYTYRIKLQSIVGISPYSPSVTITSPVGINPPPAAGLRLWLRSTAGLSGASAVSDWLDQSGRLKDAAQAEPANRPTVVNNGLNGLPVIHFDASQNQFLRLPDFMFGANAGEAFAVLRRDANYPNGSCLWNLGSGPGSRYPDGNNQIQDGFASNQWTATGQAPAFLGDFHVYNVGGDATAWFQKLNGSAYTNRSYNTVSFRPDPTIGMGLGSGGPFAGDFAEIIVYDRVLTAAERAAVQTYLNGKYRIGPVSLADTTPPAVPQPLSSSLVSANQASLVWPASIDNIGVIAYELYRDGLHIASTPGTSYTITGLTSATTYQFTIRARDAAGNASAFSPALSVTTQSPPGSAFVDTDGDGLSDAWELAHGLNPNSSADDLLDLDNDGQSNLAEYVAGTDPQRTTASDTANTSALRVIWP